MLIKNYAYGRNFFVFFTCHVLQNMPQCRRLVVNFVIVLKFSTKFTVST